MTISNLFRYNLLEPPSSWSDDFKNPQYVSPRGAKNCVGAYFFYTTFETADKVGKKAIQDIGWNENKLFITSTQLLPEANLLDLRLSFDMFEPEYMLDLLYGNGIDVLTDDFQHLNPSHRLSEIRDDYFKIRDAKKSRNQLKWDDESCLKVNRFFMGNSSHLGQCLTDFDNGFIFKQLLEEKGFDGYIFLEEIDDPTICIFDSKYLSEPSTQTFLLQ